jgi:hypothetical protein
MSDRVLLSMDDLEAAVPLNAAFEAAGYQSILISSQDDTRRVSVPGCSSASRARRRCPH